MKTFPVAIVTSCYGYGQYLGEWAASILGLATRPQLVAIVTHGSPQDAAQADAAVAQLRQAGLVVKVQHLAQRVDFGTARNAAVALADTEWVMHLDADDTLMGHALDDLALLAPQADVVGFGYERSGDLLAGPRQRRRLYHSHQGQASLDDPTPCSGVSPFRRTFWERSPYRTDLIGGWDTALWIGFAHLGARFVATTRPCFWYRQHRDSLFNTRRKSGWPKHRTGLKLQALRQGGRGVALVVPRAPDGGARDAAWSWLSSRYRAQLPAWDIRVGQGPTGEWCKGRAVQAALAGCQAGVLVIADADCVVDPDALRHAVDLVETGKAPWVVPHTTVHRLAEADTQAVLQLDPTTSLAPGDYQLARPAYTGYPGGGILVVGRVEYLAAGGIPVEFVGWGAEDQALAVILDTLLGPHTRLPGDLVHLWHPSQASKALPRANREIFRRYLLASGDEAGMWALVQGPAHPHFATYLDPVMRQRTTDARGRAVRDDAGANVRDSFAGRRLANLTNARDGYMAAALDMARQHRATRIQQQLRNEAAKALLSAPENKALLSPTPNKTTPTRYATKKAEVAAQAAGLCLEDFAGVDTGPRGVTLPQVQELAG